MGWFTNFLNNLVRDNEHDSAKKRTVLTVEDLEARRVMSTVPVSLDMDSGVLSVIGTDSKDTITVTESQDLLIVNLNGVQQNFSPNEVTRIQVFGLGKADTIDLQGTNRPAFVDGGNGHDTIIGGSADDILYGGAGRDSIQGQNGNDVLFGQQGHDYLDGGDGSDFLSGGRGADSLFGGTGSDEIYGGDGDDFIQADPNEQATARPGRQQSRSSEYADLVVGDAGNDVIYGGPGNDSLYGSSGADTVFGEDGNDAVFGGTGSDNVDAGSQYVSYPASGYWGWYYTSYSPALYQVSTNAQQDGPDGPTYSQLPADRLNSIITEAKAEVFAMLPTLPQDILDEVEVRVADLPPGQVSLIEQNGDGSAVIWLDVDADGANWNTEGTSSQPQRTPLSRRGRGRGTVVVPDTRVDLRAELVKQLTGHAILTFIQDSQ